ncbi:MAG: type II toxin-antitoxin system prevent-host-death family antitoxin [Verrucomicrobiota bacterium]
MEGTLRYIESTMKDTLTITQGQAQLPALCRKQRTTAITRNGQVVSFIVPRQRMSDLLEQMEILANPAAMKAIKKARAGRGKFHSLSVLDEN